MTAPALRRLFIGAIMGACVVASPASLAAQSADTTGFVARQWGAEIGINAGFTSLGVLRFSAPNRAWLGVVGANFERNRINEDLSDVPSGVEIRRYWDSADLEVRLGHRWYRSVASSVQQHVTVGGVIAGARRDNGGLFSSESDRAIGGGVFADVGALWMVTRRLSLGAAWNAEALGFRATVGEAPQFRRVTTSIEFGRIDLRGALYF